MAAVDAHVATHLLTQVLGRGGLLSGKTRIIATHHPNAIAAADRVAVLESGRLVEFGSYASLTGRPTSRLNAFLKSEELKKRLLSESEGISESVPASAPVASLCESVIRRRYRTSTDSTRPTSIVGPGDLAECMLPLPSRSLIFQFLICYSFCFSNSNGRICRIRS